MADPGKPLTAQARDAASYDLRTLASTADATRGSVEAGGHTAASLLQDVLAMEKILDRLRRAATREL